jgi:hypothetical protein
MARRRNSDSMCTYASRLRSESGIGPGKHTNSTRSSLSYLEACLLGRTDFTSIAPCANIPNESTLWNHRINPELTQFYYYPTRDFAEDRPVGWFTNGLETHVHLQVRKFNTNSDPRTNQSNKSKSSVSCYRPQKKMLTIY